MKTVVNRLNKIGNQIVLESNFVYTTNDLQYICDIDFSMVKNQYAKPIPDRIANKYLVYFKTIYFKDDGFLLVNYYLYQRDNRTMLFCSKLK